MRLKLLIEKAAAIVGSQARLAVLLDELPPHISNWKKGTRPCNARHRILMAQIADVDIAHAALDGIIDDALRTGDKLVAESLRKRLIELDRERNSMRVATLTNNW